MQSITSSHEFHDDTIDMAKQTRSDIVNRNRMVREIIHEPHALCWRGVTSCPPFVPCLCRPAWCGL
jgi:hypothetical protein